MPHQHMKPGAVGQYFDGPVDDSGRKIVLEVHASTCGHCNRITQFPSMKELQAYVDFCRCCMRLICLDCLGKPCDPFELKAERAEFAARLVRDGHWAPPSQDKASFKCW